MGDGLSPMVNKFFQKSEEQNVIKNRGLRYYIKTIILLTTTATPMKHIFTSEEMRPSERTIRLIKQIAYTYRAIKLNGKYEVFCLN